jgi:hypothetical protein
MDEYDFDEMLDLAKEFHELCTEYNVPEPVCKIVADMMGKAAKIIEADSETLKQVENCVMKSVEAVEKMALELNIARQENEELKIFLEAVKKFPAFQC